MNNKSFYAIVIGGVLIVGLAGAYVFMQKQEAQVEKLPKEEQVKEEDKKEGVGVEVELKNEIAVESVIVYTDAGFAPFEYVVKKGEEVIFVNTSSRSVWPASAVHPTHTVYPGTDIKDCEKKTGMFDACRGIASGQEWSVMLNEVGTWTYHDHLNATKTGIIVVKE